MTASLVTAHVTIATVTEDVTEISLSLTVSAISTQPNSRHRSEVIIPCQTTRIIIFRYTPLINYRDIKLINLSRL
ncbi:hypothetical protein RRG08_017169 [Elysia crispata]|uniref:Uncharacterized protein n=1 Tax=Elysia crispata TaxID=231223 RepID=A0AAE1E8H9_9GAST|nr:hypothetical protein RRG08_017169 [Elysia crispata]